MAHRLDAVIWQEEENYESTNRDKRKACSSKPGRF